MGHLYLTGFMACGKSTVGRMVAARLGLPFVDLDELAERRTGRSVPSIFAEGGEAAFRALERELLEEVAGWPDHVVATGGGIVEDPRNRAQMAATGHAAWLYCDVARAVERALSDGRARPLLGSGPQAQAHARALWAKRRWWYAGAPIWVDGRQQGAEQVATRLVEALAWLRVAPPAAWVLGPQGGYPVLVRRGLVRELPAVLEILASRMELGGGLLVVADAAVEALARQVALDLERSGWHATVAAVGPGEEAKQLEVVERLCEVAAGSGVDRGGLVVAVGGGAALDAAGFAAATYMRGIPWVAVPTTLLAQTDASIGGKTAVNTARVKNLMGSFHHPLAVVADPATLATLPVRQWRSGLAEVIKHGLVGDPSLLGEMDGPWAPSRADGEGFEELLRRSVAVKALVVTEDPTETGERAILNFGHTVGHALESASNFERFLHGEAVAIGMVTALLLSEELGVLQEPGLTGQVEAMLQAVGLPTTAAPDPPPAETLWAWMGKDKKRRAGHQRWVLLQRPGAPLVVSDRVGFDAFARTWSRQHGRAASGAAGGAGRE
ncbi:3-dehydroquinate synthase [Carboxydochorda subterranea]|uniref:Multifunctional fusion protein n=1 Tax=Carboxydichorda subterranea TaxID=3109565 RepID=A0ABZ1C0G5_9FIRM|nr:3-dehydroquinate synthase [Limnochorda sp. L945t]WRP18315.1 3-dehydroquinate synthase [Limnochorda sp. L945t]